MRKAVETHLFHECGFSATFWSLHMMWCCLFQCTLMEKNAHHQEFMGNLNQELQSKYENNKVSLHNIQWLPTFAENPQNINPTSFSF